MISKQAREFWKMLQTYPKQIQMPLAQARAADVPPEDFPSVPAGVTFTPAPEVEGLWAEPPYAITRKSYTLLLRWWIRGRRSRERPRDILLLPQWRVFSCGNIGSRPEHPFPAGLEDGVRAYQSLVKHDAEPSKTVVAGDSAGGGLAISTVIALGDRDLSMPGGNRCDLSVD